MDFGFPEHGRLRRVLMHAPGPELDRIRPASYGRYLFEDAVDPVAFRRQHEHLVDALRGEGVQVALVGDVLRGSPLLERTARSPNLVYTRDTTTVMPGGGIRMGMRSPVRRDEPRIVAAALERLGVPEVLRIRAPATLEGGDLIFADAGTLLVGVGNRSSRAALHEVWAYAQTRGLRTIVAVPLPNWAIHLDGTMMIADEDLAIVHPASLRAPALVHEPGRPPKRVPLLSLLKRRGFRFVEVTAYERQRRATNAITLGPRKLVAYGGHARVRGLLAEEGVDLIEIDGSELVRGGGGPRCMTAPLERGGTSMDSRSTGGGGDEA
ncbi:MAG TPA: arginine deiminase family protein [Thermoplasmata archaeon]|nr:arginine deiminase family protein [Thermoplasmata archaeon]